MIRLKDDGITWEHEDVRMMAKIIGSEFAVISAKKDRGWMPLVASVLKLARDKGVPMSGKALLALTHAEDDATWARIANKAEDAHIPNEPRSAQYFAHQRADLARMYDRA